MQIFFEGECKMSKRDKITFIIRFMVYLAVILYSLFGTIQDEWTICNFKNLTGLNCYTCGMTRAFMCFFRLDFVRAIKYNPLVIVFVPIFLFIALEDTMIFIYNLITNKTRYSFIKHYTL
jgi:hypothetical protein